jgi:hypothetical protein
VVMGKGGMSLSQSWSCAIPGVRISLPLCK